MNILYTGKYSPTFYFCPFCSHCQQANLRLSKYKFLILSLLNATVFGRIQDRTKSFTSAEGRKKHRAIITLYTVVHVLTTVLTSTTSVLLCWIQVCWGGTMVLRTMKGLGGCPLTSLCKSLQPGRIKIIKMKHHFEFHFCSWQMHHSCKLKIWPTQNLLKHISRAGSSLAFPTK